jgi:hypothetical protein
MKSEPPMILRVARLIFPALLIAVLIASAPPATANDKTDALYRIHDWKTSVAMGNRYLKQQALVATRDALARLGREQGLGAAWRPGNLHFDAAERAVVAPLLEDVQRDWTSLAWLPAEWEQLSVESFSDAELGTLVAHLSSEVGRKQAKIIDHSVAFHAGGAYTMSGKLLQDYPGTEAEQKTLTYIWDEEDREMRFSVDAVENVEGQRFALSPLGAKYQRTLIIKFTGVINARLDKVAAGLPAKAASGIAQAAPFVTNVRADAGR